MGIESRRDVRATVLCAAATMLAALPLWFVYESLTWLVGVVVVVVAMTAVAVGLRMLGLPHLAGTLGMIITYSLCLTWLFASGHAWLGVVPTPHTLVRFYDLLGEAGVAARQSGVPVADAPSLRFLAALGVGGVLLAIDVAVVVARWTLIAGFPMLAVHAVVVGSDRGIVSAVSFACVAFAFLWLLAADNSDRVRRFGRRFTDDGRDVEPWRPLPLAAAGRRMATVGVVLAVVVTLAVPGLGTGLVDRLELPRATNGSGQRSVGAVNLFSFLSGSLRRDSVYGMATVATTDPDPHYLRFGVADQLTVDGFVDRRPNRSLPVRDMTVAQPPDVPARAYTAEVTVGTFAERLLPVFLQPTGLRGVAGDWAWDDAANVVHSSSETAQGKRYSFSFVRFDHHPDLLRRAPDLAADDPVRQQFTHVPTEPVIMAKAAELVRGRTTPYDRVRALHDFFSAANGFRYELRTRPGNSGSAMVDFVTTGRVGYCEQYAAALAWLVRAVGVPARVAFGFTRGERTGAGTYTLTNANLHAWTEVYFRGYGWVPFDATPAAAVVGSVSTAWAPDDSGAPRPAASPAAPTVEAGAASPGPVGAATTPPAAAPAAGGPLTRGSRAGWPFAVLGGVLLAVLLLSLPALQRAALRRRRSPRGGAGVQRTRRDAHAAWDELLDLMIDYRIAAGPTETCRAIGERLIRDGGFAPAAATGVRTLSRAEERAMYARQPLADADLASALREVRSGLREHAPRRTRIVAAVLPPSVLARWRSAVRGG